MNTNNTNGYAFDATDAFSSLFNVPVGVIGYASTGEKMTDEAVRDICDKLAEKLDEAAFAGPCFAVKKEPAGALKPVAIHRNGKSTTVIWNDDTFTVVNLREENEDSPYTAFAYALCKKVFGCGMKGIVKMVEGVHTDFIRERREAEKAKRREEQEARHRANLAKKAAEENAKKIGFANPATAPCPTCLL